MDYFACRDCSVSTTKGVIDSIAVITQTDLS